MQSNNSIQYDFCRFRCHNMGFLCERVRQKIEQHREHYNYTQWSDNIDDCLPAKLASAASKQHQSTDEPNECIYALAPANGVNVQLELHAPSVHQRRHHQHCVSHQHQQRDDSEPEHCAPDNGTSVSSWPHHRPQKPIGNGFIKRITQLISFNPGHRESTPAQASTKTAEAASEVTNLPGQRATTDIADIASATTSVSTATTTTTTSTTATTSTVTSSHSSLCIVRQSLCLYAASSFILALCYFATTASAAEAAHPM